MNTTLKITQACAIFFEKRILSIYLLGIAQGLPWVIIGSSLTVWLKEAGMSRTNIGFAGLIYSVYAINYLWAPLVDRIQLPLFCRFGRRKSWIIFCQTIIVFFCFLISLLDAGTDSKLIVLLALVIASASATQDVAIDAYRIDRIDPKDSAGMSAAAGAVTAGWWSAFAGIGAIPLILSDHGWTWPSLYLLLAGISIAVALAVLCVKDEGKPISIAANPLGTQIAGGQTQIKLIFIAVVLLVWVVPFWALLGAPGLEPSLESHPLFTAIVVGIVLLLLALLIYLLTRLTLLPNSETFPNSNTMELSSAIDNFLSFLIRTFIDPLRDFFMRQGVQIALGILAFILLFKIGEAFLGRMSIVFYKDIGFTNSEIAKYSKMLTWVITAFGAAICGVLNARLGLFKGLIISGIAMAASNLLLALIAVMGPKVNLLIVAVAVDSFTAAWGTVAFVSFVSSLCNKTFSATQYALLVSLSNLGRTTIASYSGLAIDMLHGNWAIFFIATTLMVIPSLIILRRIWPKLSANLNN